MRPSLSSLFPARLWINKVSPDSLRADLFAGFSNAAIVVPQGVAFATIAGLPPEYGLYTAMITAVVAALWGSSMVMISGPTTAISALLFATLQDLAVPGSAEFIQLALLLTVMVGVAEFERARMRERQRAGINRARRTRLPSRGIATCPTG